MKILYKYMIKGLLNQLNTVFYTIDNDCPKRMKREAKSF